MMRKLYRLLPALVAVLAWHGVGAQSLVSAEELRAELAAQAAPSKPVVRAKSLPQPGAPRIEIQSPDTLGGSLTAPFEIRVHFTPESGAQIVPDSFRVLYGVLGVDITARVMKYGTLKDNLLRIEHANIPPGRHRLSIRIRDSEQREGQADLAFVVQDKKE